jgi:hypothetical protein
MNDKNPTQVLALTILDASSADLTSESLSLDTDILMVVRRKDVHRQHAEIGCVPTERIPKVLFDSIVNCAEICGREDSGYYLKSSPTSSLLHPGAHPLTYVVKSLFNQKLGVADNFEKGDIQFTAEPKIVRTGPSPVFSENDIPEVHQMLNVAVYLTEGKEYIPSETTSYLHLEWHSIGEILKKVNNNQPLPFGQSNLTFPLGGLCLCSIEWLQHQLFSQTLVS